MTFCNSFPWQRCVSIMARIHSIEIFYASSNPALGKILLKFSDGEGGILTKSVEGRILLGICRMNIDRLSSFFQPIHIMEFTAAATGAHTTYAHREQARWDTFFEDKHERWALFIRWATKMSTFFSDEQPRWALFKRWATKMSTFFSDEQPRWALFSRWATKMSTFSSNEQPRWGAS